MFIAVGSTSPNFILETTTADGRSEQQLDDRLAAGEQAEAISAEKAMRRDRPIFYFCTLA